MTETISLDMLEEVLNPSQRDYETIYFEKTYEIKVDDQIHVGFIAYVAWSPADYSNLIESYSVLKDVGYIIFTEGNDYHDDYVSEKEETIIIEDPTLPEIVRKKWISYLEAVYDSYGLEDLEHVLENLKEYPLIERIIRNKIANYCI